MNLIECQAMRICIVYLYSKLFTSHLNTHLWFAIFFSFHFKFRTWLSCCFSICPHIVDYSSFNFDFALLFSRWLILKPSVIFSSFRSLKLFVWFEYGIHALLSAYSIISALMMKCNFSKVSRWRIISSPRNNLSLCFIIRFDSGRWQRSGTNIENMHLPDADLPQFKCDRPLLMSHLPQNILSIQPASTSSNDWLTLHDMHERNGINMTHVCRRLADGFRSLDQQQVGRSQRAQCWYSSAACIPTDCSDSRNIHTQAHVLSSSFMLSGF